MTVRVYRYDDVDAPVLTGATGSVNDLIKACLVTGYGAKAGAGWTEEFTTTNISAYKMGAAPFNYLRVNDSAAVGVATRIIGYKTMSDVNTGTIPFPTEAQIAGGGWIQKSVDGTTARPWIIIADENSFHLIYQKAVLLATNLTSVTYSEHVYFGNLLGANSGDIETSIIITNYGTGNSYSGGYINNSFGVSSGHYTMNRFDGSINVDGSLQVGKTPLLNVGQTNINATTTFVYPDPITNGLLLSRIHVIQNTAPIYLRGYIKGMWNSVNFSNSPLALGDTFTSVINGITRTFIVLPLTSGSGTYSKSIFEISDTWEL